MCEYSVNYNGNKAVYTDTYIPWRFKTADGKDYSLDLTLERSEHEIKGINYQIYEYKDCSQSFRAKRICFTDKKNISFFCDVIKSSKDICVYTDFIAENKDYSTSCNVADKNKLVIRNNKCGVKHFKLHSEIDGNSFLEKSGLMMPVSVKECGDIVYSMYEGLYSFGKEHISSYGIVTDNIEDIIWWHFNKTEEGYMAEPPSKKDGLEIRVSDNVVKLYECLTGECLISIEL